MILEFSPPGGLRMFSLGAAPPPSLRVGLTAVVLIVKLGPPVRPGKKQPEANADLSISVCAAALRRWATEERGRPGQRRETGR